MSEDDELRESTILAWEKDSGVAVSAEAVPRGTRRTAITTGEKHMREWDIGKRLADLLYCWTFFGIIIYIGEKVT